MPTSAQVAELLRHGIAAAKAGRKQEARQLLFQVTELDEQNEQAWLWLSGVVESLEDRRVCLENVLAINPHNTHAQAGLHWLDGQSPSPAPQDCCPRCKAVVPPSKATCPHCGQVLVVVCPACGRSVGDLNAGAGYHLALARAYLAYRKPRLAQEAV